MAKYTYSNRKSGNSGKRGNSLLKRLFLKLTSTKFLITVWACFLVSYIVIKRLDDFSLLAEILSGVPFSYFGINMLQKKIEQ